MTHTMKFVDGNWEKEIDVRDFVMKNYRPYDGYASFLTSGPAKDTDKVWSRAKNLIYEEMQKGGVLDINTDIPSSIISFGPGYINKEHEKIVGLQTDAPLKRSIKPQGGIRMVE